MDDLYRHLEMPPELAMEFIATFSRAEHALKSTSYAKGHENSVSAAWDIFANEIHEDFERITEMSIVEASNFLLGSPPRKQVLRNGVVEFKEQTIDQDQKRTQQLFLMIRTVRNNLFHGGKYLPHGEREAGRNEKLVRASLVILKVGIDLKEEVRASFEH